MPNTQQNSNDNDSKLLHDVDPDEIERERKEVAEADVVTFREALEARRATLAAMPEERILRERFGQDYVDYTARVRRWL